MLVQKLLPAPASHLFLSSFSKANRRSIVAKAEEVGREFFFSKYRGRIIKGGRRGEEGGNETGGENQLAFTTGGINFVNLYLLYFTQII